MIIIDPTNVGKKNLWLIVGGTLILAGTLYFSLLHRNEGPAVVGDSAPNFSIPSLGHGLITLRDYRGKVVVLNFWATWCPPCVEETPSLEDFAKKTRGEGVTVIGVSVDQDGKALEKFVADSRLTYIIARDPTRALATRYGTLKFPETYILDRDGKVADKIIGAINWNDPRILMFVDDLAWPAGSNPH